MASVEICQSCNKYRPGSATTCPRCSGNECKHCNGSGKCGLIALMEVKSSCEKCIASIEERVEGNDCITCRVCGGSGKAT